MIGSRLRLSTLPPAIRAALASIRLPLVVIVLASALINLLMLAGPIFMLQVYDRVLPSRSLSTLTGLLLIVAVLLIIQGVVDSLRSRLLHRISEAFDGGVRDAAFDSTQHAALTRRDGDPLQTLRDLDSVRGFIAGSGLIAACDLPWTPVYILVCALFHPLMGVGVAIGALALCAITVATEFSTRTPTRALVGLAASRRAAGETAVHHAETVRALGIGGRMRQIWTERSDAFLDGQRRVADLNGGFGSASRFLRTALQSGILALGAYLVVLQEATPGIMLAATILSVRALAPIELAIANWRSFIASREAFQRLCAQLNAMPQPTALTELPRPQRSLQVNSVSVTAPRTERLVVNNISFQLAAGSAVAIIGPSGSGKSTFARALVGIVPALRGVIRIDGAALAQWDPGRLGEAIGYLPQDVALFSGTVAQNIARFAEAPDPARIIAAAREAGVHDLILRLPNGYETEVGDGGSMLSGGQRQRVALARALYGDPFLVVLDEPNSNLDTEGEQALLQAIRRVRARGGILVIVAHRPTLLSAVDHLLVLNGGQMQAFGRTEAVLPLLTPRPAVPKVDKPAATKPAATKSAAPRRKRTSAAEGATT